MARLIAVWLGLALAPAWGMSAALAANQSQNAFYTSDVGTSDVLEDELQHLIRLTKPPLQVAQMPAVADLEAQIPRLPAPERSLGMQRTMPQVTSVNQLSDVRPTDWAYQPWRHWWKNMAALPVIPIAHSVVIARRHVLKWLRP